MLSLLPASRAGFPFILLNALREAWTRYLLLHLLKMADNHLG